MKSFSVHWAQSASNDLETIIEYIANDNLTVAVRTLRKIQKLASKLKRTPYRGRVVPELRRQGVESYRELMIFPWRLVYRIHALKVFVVSVIDARRDVESILLERLIRH